MRFYPPAVERSLRYGISKVKFFYEFEVRGTTRRIADAATPQSKKFDGGTLVFEPGSEIIANFNVVQGEGLDDQSIMLTLADPVGDWSAYFGRNPLAVALRVFFEINRQAELELEHVARGAQMVVAYDGPHQFLTASFQSRLHFVAGYLPMTTSPGWMQNIDPNDTTMDNVNSREIVLFGTNTLRDRRSGRGV